MVTAGFLALLLQVSSGPNLLPLPGVQTTNCKWSPWDGHSTSIAGEYEVDGSPYPETGTVEGFNLINPPVETHLILSVKVRGNKAKQHFNMTAVGYNTHLPKGEGWTAWWEKSYVIDAGKWTTLERDICLPKGSDRLRVIIGNPNSDSVRISDLKLVAGVPGSPDPVAIATAKENIEIVKHLADKQPDTVLQRTADADARSAGVVINHVHIRGPIRTGNQGEVGTATFPVPAMDPGQIPIAFKITCDMPGQVLSAKWTKRPDGRNTVCKVQLKPGSKGVWVQYDALVLSPSGHMRDLTPPTWLAATNRQRWTRGTACVQTFNSEIQAMAKKLSAPNDSSESYARKVFAFVRDYRGKGAPFKTLDAVACVQSEGSCTNKANLTAALLRVHGIPARTVSHMPTWAPEAIYEHWLTEFWQPDKGWVAIDPELGRWDPDRRTRIVLATSSEEDEDLAFEKLHTRFVMPGAPYASSLEISSTLYPADIEGSETDAINTSNRVSRYIVDAGSELRLLAAANHAYLRMMADLTVGKATAFKYDRVNAAVSSGSAATLERVLRTR